MQALLQQLAQRNPQAPAELTAKTARAGKTTQVEKAERVEKVTQIKKVKQAIPVAAMPAEPAARPDLRKYLLLRRAPRRI